MCTFGCGNPLITIHKSRFRDTEISRMYWFVSSVQGTYICFFVLDSFLVMFAFCAAVPFTHVLE